MHRSRIAAGLLLSVVVLGSVRCTGIANLTDSTSVSLALAAPDSLPVADSVELSIARAPTGVLASEPSWILSDTTRATLLPRAGGRALLRGRTLGTVRITARLTGTEFPGGVLAVERSLTVIPGRAARLQLQGAPAGVALAPGRLPAFVVRVVDVGGNTATRSTRPVRLTLQAVGPALEAAPLGESAANGLTLSGRTSASPVNGIATFDSVFVSGTGSNVVLAAESDSLPTVATASPVRVALPARVTVLDQPTAVTAGAVFAPTFRVAVQDAGGNTLTNATTPVQVAMANPGSGAVGSLVNTAAVVPANGIADFSNLRLNQSATGVRLRFRADGVPDSAVSGPITVVHAPRVRLTFGPLPTDITATEAFASDVVVRGLDAFDNVTTTDTSLVTLSITNVAAGTTLSGTLTRRASAGVAIFPGLAISTANSAARLVASSSGLVTSFPSDPFVVSPAAGPRARVQFGTQPTSAIAGDPLGSVTARITDAAGLLVKTATDSVTISLTSPAGVTGAVLRGTARVAAVGGIATFSALNVNRAANGFTLSAAAPGLTSATSSAFNVTAGAAQRVVVTTAPATATAGVAFALSAALADSLGNVQGTASGTISVEVDSGPAGSTLLGPTALVTQAGAATFSALQLRATGRHRLRVCSGLLACGSAALDVTIGAPARVRIVNAPSVATAGVPLGAEFGVEVLDVGGNRVPTATTAISVSLAAGPGGALLSGTTSASAASGLALFPSVRLRTAGTGYRLRATASGLTSDSTSLFDVSPAPAAALRFVQAPTSVIARAIMTPPVTVEVLDSLTNRATAAAVPVTLTLNTSSQGISATLGGTAVRASVAGLATFDDLVVARASLGWTITASADNVSPITSPAFNVTAGAPAAIRFLDAIPAARAGSPISPAVRVAIVDSAGEVSSSVAATGITIALGANPGSTSLAGTLTRSTVQGIASFDNLSLPVLANGYTLVASTASFGTATSSAFNVGPGTPSQLAFVQQPSATVAGVVIAPALQVQVRDAGGNLVANATDTVRLSLANNPAADTLRGTLSAVAVNGVATFDAVRLRRAATGITVRASATNLTAATSAAFAVTPAPAVAVRIAQQPGNVNVGTAFNPAVTAEVRDSLGNRVTSDSATVVALAVNDTAGTFGLSGTTSRAVIGGLASFSGVSVTAPAIGRRLRVSSPGLGVDSSTVFNAIGPVTQLVFTTLPTSVVRGTAFAAAPVVVGRDALGQNGFGFTAAAVVTVDSGPAGQTLGGTTSVSPASGTATFNGLTLSAAGRTRLRVTSNIAGGTQVSVVSDTFTVRPFGAPASLQFVDQPTATVIASGQTTGTIPTFRVRLRDAQGNTVDSSTATVTVALTQASTCGPLAGTTSVAAVGGVATFSAVAVSSRGTGCQLVVSSGGLTGATSLAFSAINENDPAVVVITTEPPATATAGVAWNQVVAQVRNGLGQLVSTFGGSVTLSIVSGPGTTLGTTVRTVNAVSGVATFTGVTLTVAGSYRFAVSSSGLQPDTTASALTVNPAPQSQLRVLREPQAAAVEAGTAFTDAFEVEVTDGFGNRVQSFSTVTMRPVAYLRGGCGPVPRECGAWTAPYPAGFIAGDTIVQAINGVARFTGMRFRLTALIEYVDFTSPGLTSARSGLDQLPGTRLAINPAPAFTLRMATALPTSYLSGLIARQPFETPCSYNRFATSNLLTTCQPDGYGTVIVADSLGNAAVSSGPVTVRLLTDSSNILLSGVTTKQVFAGTYPGWGHYLGTGAYFGNLVIDRGGDGFRFEFSHPTLGTVTSPSFSVAPFGTATQLVTVQSPTAAIASGLAFQIRVQVQDQFGNRVLSATRSLTLSAGTPTTPTSLPSGLTVSCTAAGAMTQGESLFNCSSTNTTGTAQQVFFRVIDNTPGSPLPTGGVPPFTVNP